MKKERQVNSSYKKDEGSTYYCDYKEADQAFEIAKMFGRINHSNLAINFEYETFGLKIVASVDQTETKKVEVKMNDRLVLQCEMFLDDAKFIRVISENMIFVPGIWEKMIDVLYSDVVWLNNSKKEQKEIYENILLLLAYCKEDKSTDNSLNDIPLDIFYNEQGFESDGRFMKCKVYYQNDQVFLCKLDGTCVDYVPGEWEQIIRDLIQKIETENKNKQEAEDLKSYNDFMRSRKK